VSIDPPNFLSLSVRTAIMSDPRQFDLRNLSLYYYQIGERLLSILPRTGGGGVSQNDLYSSLVFIFYTRLLDIKARAENCRDEDTSEYRDRLSELELSIFNAGCVFSRDTIKWRRREAEKLCASTAGSLKPLRTDVKRRAISPPTSSSGP